VVLGASAVVTLASLALRALSLFTSPITTRLFSTEAYGVAAAVGTGTTIFSLLAVAGTDIAYSRCGLSPEFGPGEVERLFWRIGLVLAAIASALAGLAWALGLAHWLKVGIGFAGALAVTVGVTALNSLSMLRRRLTGGYVRIAASILVSGIATIVFVIACGKVWRRDAWPLVIASALGPAIQVCIQGVPSLRTLLSPSRIDWATAIRLLRIGLPGLATMPGYWVVASSDRWFLAGLAGADAAGVYSIAFNLAMMGQIVNNAIVLVWYPEVSRLVSSSDEANAKSEIGRVWAQLVTMLAVVALAVATAGGDALYLMTPTSFHGGARLIPIIAAGGFFYAIYHVANTGLYVSENMAPVAAWWVLGSITSILLNVLAVPRLGAMASALALFSSFFMISVGTMYSSQRRWPLAIPWARLGGSLAFIFFSGLVLCRPWHHKPLLSLVAKLPVGVMVAAISLQLVAPRWWAKLLPSKRQAPTT
jgi:O-antigen/teichoic acid export membrane protein